MAGVLRRAAECAAASRVARRAASMEAGERRGLLLLALPSRLRRALLAEIHARHSQAAALGDRSAWTRASPALALTERPTASATLSLVSRLLDEAGDVSAPHSSPAG